MSFSWTTFPPCMYLPCFLRKLCSHFLQVSRCVGIVTCPSLSERESPRPPPHNSHFISFSFVLLWIVPFFFPPPRIVFIPTKYSESLSSWSPPHYIPELNLKVSCSLFAQWISVTVRKFEKKMGLRWRVFSSWRVDQHRPQPLWPPPYSSETTWKGMLREQQGLFWL